MIEHQGIYLPEGERHLQGWMDRAGEIVDGRGTYQIKKLRAALSHCSRFRVAIDIGAHVGMWTMQLAKAFAHVHAFEPVREHRECFALNVDALNVTLHPFALGDADASVAMHTSAGSSGDSWVDGTGDVEMTTLDAFELEDVDLIKADTEGYELFALRGAQQTIARSRPVIIVEQKPGRAEKYGVARTEAVAYLERAGYTLAQAMSGDYIMVP